MLKNIIHLAISITAFSLAYSIAFLTEIDLVKSAILYAFVIQWVLFVPAYLLKTEKFYDLSGSLTYIFVVSYVSYNYYLIDGINFGNIIIGLAIIFWAVRLGSFLFLRIHKAGEDRRFNEIKTSATRFFMTWTLQGMWVSICSACALTAISSSKGVQINYLLFIGLAIFLIGFFIEVIADNQKTKFRSNPENKNNFISSGLWSYSRHPNYLGEIILWLGITIMSISSLNGWQFVTLISPVFTYVLLVYISGVRLLEASGKERWGHLESYQEYLKKTPSLIFK
jgi:steroid 5-alpha reductase family enzyme|tara:strand:- start:3069 stop:3914 length:846 start_codon:yes stop_codon:yes gene_type:complete